MWTHGKRATYIHTGCRCDECRAANTRHHRRRRRDGRVPPGGTHGLSGYNNYGCRCEVCTEAQRVKNAAYYQSAVRSRKS